MLYQMDQTGFTVASEAIYEEQQIKKLTHK